MARPKQIHNKPMNRLGLFAWVVILLAAFSFPTELQTRIILLLLASLIATAFVFYKRQEPPKRECGICGTPLDPEQEPCPYCGHRSIESRYHRSR